jgi:small subunit ribosomal protein S20
MPNTTSAKKRLRQDKVRRQRNRSTKSAMRSQIRRVREAVAAGDIEKAEQEFRVAAKRLDQAGAGHVIHPNRAGRLKSRLQHLIKKAKQAKAVA